MLLWTKEMIPERCCMSERARIACGVVLWVTAAALGQATPPGEKPAESPAKVEQEPVRAGAVVERCVEMYKGLKTYEDTGQVVQTMTVGGRRTVSRQPFETRFQRPDRFYYQFKGSVTPGAEPRSTYAVWADGSGKVRSHWDLMGGDQEQPSLDMALAGPTGISGGSAIKVPSLLLVLPPARWLTEFEKDFKIAGREQVDGVECYRIERTNLPEKFTETEIPDAQKTKLRTKATAFVIWIGVKDSALRKVLEGTDFGEFQAESVTTYSPKLDAPIDAERFKFRAGADQEKKQSR
jgi:hypothetical protein